MSLRFLETLGDFLNGQIVKSIEINVKRTNLRSYPDECMYIHMYVHRYLLIFFTIFFYLFALNFFEPKKIVKFNNQVFD